MTAWLQAFHLISIMMWFAGLFYLPRLFKYHAFVLRQDDPLVGDRFEVMERKLYRVIMNPSMIATIIFGLLLVIPNYQYVLWAPWFWIKVALVVVLIGYHHICLGFMRKLRVNKGHSPIFYKIFSMISPLIMAAIIILSVVKPF